MLNKQVKISFLYLVFNAISWLIILGISIYQLKEKPRCPDSQQKQVKCVNKEEK